MVDKITPKSKIDARVGRLVDEDRVRLNRAVLVFGFSDSKANTFRPERGKIAPSLEILVLLASRLHKSVDWIIRGESG